MLLGWREAMALRRKGCFYLITVLLVVAPRPAHTHTVAVAVGDNYTLKPDYSGEFSAIKWLFNNDLLVELELPPSPFLKFFQLQGRATIDNGTGALAITHLTKSQSGDYKAEVVLRNGTFLSTVIKLNVLDRVSKPNIREQITEEQITVTCESATADVNYTWLGSQNKTVSTERTYSMSRPREGVQLTCIVQNQVSNDSASIIIHPLTDSSVIGVVVAVLLVLLILILPVLAIEIIRRYCKNKTCGQVINSRIPPFPYCKKGPAGKVHDVENGAKEQENLLTNQQKDPEPFSITLRLREGDTDGLKIKRDGDVPCETELQEIALNGQNLCKSDDSAEFTAELLLADGRTDSHLIKDPPHSLDIKLAKEVTLKTEDGVLAKVILPGSQPFVADVLLSQKSLGIKNLKPGYDGKYEVCFPENPSVEFHIQVKKEDHKNMLKIVRRIVHQSQGRGAQDPIGSITLQPSGIAGGYMWKRGEEKLLATSQKIKGDIFQDGKIKIDWETGDLTLQEVTPLDSNTYCLTTSDGKLYQEFSLAIEGQ